MSPVELLESDPETNPQEVVVSEFEISEGDLVSDIRGILSDCILECPENVGVGWVVVGIAVWS